MRYILKSYFVTSIVIGAIIGIAILLSNQVGPTINKDSTEIFKNDEALYSYVRKYGPKQSIIRLNELVPLYGSCHNSAHRAGHFAYEIYSTESFRTCGSECHSGCYHGATEAFFKEHGTANLTENLRTLCDSELNAFFSHQCIHGIGHGLMAWTSYELFDALESCDLLSARQSSCWTGVFMENIVGTLGQENGHTTKYLSQDPLYPCNDPKLDEKYKSSCYFLQTSRMVQLYGVDFAKVAAACLQAPTSYQHSCFESMGRDIGGVHHADPSGAIAACQNAPIGNIRISCLIGAAQDTFWDPGGQDIALSFCKLLTNQDEKNSCYQTIFSRATEVLTSNKFLTVFCDKVEQGYREACRKVIR